MRRNGAGYDAKLGGLALLLVLPVALAVLAANALHSLATRATPTPSTLENMDTYVYTPIHVSQTYTQTQTRRPTHLDKLWSRDKRRGSAAARAIHWLAPCASVSLRV